MTGKITIASRLAPTILTALFGAMAVLFWAGTLYTSSTDFGLHYALTREIGSSLTWPTQALANLEEMSLYPPVTHAVGAILGYVLGSPITGMAAAAILGVFLSYAIILAMMRFARTAATLLAALVFLALIVGLYSSNIVIGGEIKENFFYAQVTSFAGVLLLAKLIFSGRLRPLVVAAASIAITFCLGWVFPMATMQFSCTALAYFGLGAAKGAIARQKSAWLHVGLLVALGIALPVTIMVHPTFALIKAIAAWQGGILLGIPVEWALPIIASCAVPIAALAATYLLNKLRLDNPLPLTTFAVGVFGAALAQILALWVGLGSPYGIAKHIFPVVTLAAAAGAALVANTVAPWLDRRMNHLAINKSIAACAGFAAFAIVFSTPGRSTAPLEKAQRFIAEEVPKDGCERIIALARTLLPAENFALSLGDLRHPKKAAAVRILGIDILARRHDSAIILANAPLDYAVIEADAGPKVPDQCVAARSDKAGLLLVAARCLGPDTPYVLGDRITIAELRRDPPFLSGGWSQLEPWGVWSDGPSATLTLPLSELPSGELKLDAETTAYLSADVPQQRVEILAGGRLLGTWVYSTTQQTTARSLVIPASTIDAGRLTLTLRFPDAATPPGGTRRLALGLKSFSVAESRQ